MVCPADVAVGSAVPGEPRCPLGWQWPAASPCLGIPSHSMRMKMGHLHLSKTSSSASCPRDGGAQPPSLLAGQKHHRGHGHGVLLWH